MLTFAPSYRPTVNLLEVPVSAPPGLIVGLSLGGGVLLGVIFSLFYRRVSQHWREEVREMNLFTSNIGEEKRADSEESSFIVCKNWLAARSSFNVPSPKNMIVVSGNAQNNFKP